jgi:hypothetical protein
MVALILHHDQLYGSLMIGSVNPHRCAIQPDQQRRQSGGMQ